MVSKTTIVKAISVDKITSQSSSIISREYLFDALPSDNLLGNHGNQY